MAERFDPQVLTHLTAFLRVESLTRLPETHGLGCEKDSFCLAEKKLLESFVLSKKTIRKRGLSYGPRNYRRHYSYHGRLYHC